MKAYKIDLSGFTGKIREVVSEAVQKKAFKLGYEWCDTGKEIFSISSLSVIHFAEDGKMHGKAYKGATSCMTLITADAFLALESAEPEFKPFDKVLVRDTDEDEWRAVEFSHKREGIYAFCACGAMWRQCIPYEGNEHLIGTTNKE